MELKKVLYAQASLITDRASQQFEELNEAQRAYYLIKSAILKNELPVGTPISQLCLQEKFGVSRTPLREAINRLASENLLIAERNKRIIISAYKSVDIDQLLAMRIVMETLAMRITIPLLSEDEFAEMEQCLRMMKRSCEENDEVTVSASHHKFHLLFCSKAGQYLFETIFSLQEQAVRYQLIYSENYLFDYDSHYELYKACRDKDVDRAVALTALHYSRVAFAVLSAYDPLYEPVAVREAVRLANIKKNIKDV